MDEWAKRELNECKDQKCLNFTILKIVVNAKKQNKIGWPKEYDAELAGDCILLSRRPKQHGTPKENIVVDVTQSAIIYDDKKCRIFFTSPAQMKYIAAMNKNDYWKLKETILQIRYRVKHSSQAENMLLESVEMNAKETPDRTDHADEKNGEDEQQKLRADEKNSNVVSESSSDCFERNLELCRMGFALSRECPSDDIEINGEKFADDSSASFLGTASPENGIMCEHKYSVSSCECHKLYKDAVGLYKEANDLLREVKQREGNINVAYERIMNAVDRNHCKDVNKATPHIEKVEAICQHKRRPVSSRIGNPTQHSGEFEALLPDVSSNELSDVEITQPETTPKIISPGRSVSWRHRMRFPECNISLLSSHKELIPDCAEENN